MAKKIACKYENERQLNRFIEENQLLEYPNILVQVFSEIRDQNILYGIQKSITSKLPLATMIGYSSFGEVIEDSFIQDHIVISFTIFDQMNSNVFQYNEYNSFDVGLTIDHLLRASQEDIKVLNEKAMVCEQNYRSEQKKIEEKMMRLAYYDQDTGLPNRMKFTEKLVDLLDKAKRKKRILAVMIIDMDRFKIVNDSFGHDAGDEVLKEMSTRIQKALPIGSYMGRFSGDKFNIVFTKNVNVDEIVRIAKSILNRVAEPVFHSNQEFIVTSSIGVSFFPNDGLDETTLMKNADTAMNRSKYPGGNRVTLYSNEMNEEAIKRLEFESYLRKALKKNEFFLCYQPLVDLASGIINGSEALIRWNHPKLGLVSPGEFIPLAEETGLIEEIGSWVLRTACKQNKKWQRMGMEDLVVSVNVSANQFSQPRFVNEVKEALWESGLDAQYLTLELTESTMLRNLDYSINVMKALQELGVKVSIDDFGTGYSSLSYLKDLPINTLKIDRSFINNLRSDTSDIAIVKAIITMGQGLSVKVVAEGVETKEQIEVLKELKCHYAQGFYINRPLSIEDFEENLLKAMGS